VLALPTAQIPTRHQDPMDHQRLERMGVLGEELPTVDRKKDSSLPFQRVHRSHESSARSDKLQ
jgi:hypothetical protein